MRRPRRVAVQGSSMVPTLRGGEHVLVLPVPVRKGRLAVLRDPRQPDRIIIKRVIDIEADGLAFVQGDNANASTDSRVFGLVPPELFLGRPAYRYAPADLAGWIWNA